MAEWLKLPISCTLDYFIITSLSLNMVLWISHNLFEGVSVVVILWRSFQFHSTSG